MSIEDKLSDIDCGWDKINAILNVTHTKIFNYADNVLSLDNQRVATKSYTKL